MLIHCLSKFGVTMAETTIAPAIPLRFTRPHTTRHWGRDYDVTPAVFGGYLGNGRQLLWVQPLCTRPNYYLIRIDSSWRVDDSDEWYDRFEEVIDALEEEFSEKEREREYLADDLRAKGIEPDGWNTDLAGNEDRLGFPVLSLDCGCAWNSIAKFSGGRWRSR